MHLCRLLAILVFLILVFPSMGTERNYSIKAFEDTIPTQENRILFAQSGFQFGLPFVYEKLPEGKYVPLLLQGDIDFQFKKKTSTAFNPNRFYLYLEPTANPVMIPDTTSSLEMGVTIGLKYGYYFLKYNSVKLHVSTGPQYQHLNSLNQAQGIIFSDNFGISYQRDLKKKPLYLSLGYRFRHISNLNLNLPNGGIDTHFILMGIGRNRSAH